MSASLASAALAAAPQQPVDPAKVTPGVIGFLVFAALIAATWLLLRSFVRHLGRIQVPRQPAASAGSPAQENKPGAEARQSYRTPVTPPYE